MRKSYPGSLVLGTMVILVGVLLLIRNVFDIDIPIFSIIISLGLIWIGIKLITGQMQQRKDAQRVVFGESFMKYTPGQTSYGVSFGSASLNLNDLKPEVPLVLFVDCQFGEMKVILNKEVPVQINGNASFANLTGPDLRSISFGNYSYTSAGFNPALPGITIQGKVAFGELRIFVV